MLKPLALSVWLSEFAFDVIGLHAAYSVDYYVLDFALEHDLPVLGLNPLEHEIALAFHLPDEIQIYVAKDIADLETTISYATLLTEAYETQDIAQITYFLREAAAVDSDSNLFVRYMTDVLIIQRSIEFAQEIIRLLEETEEPTVFFITMGIGHMVGEDYGNVFHYLTSAGFEVEALFEEACDRPAPGFT